VTNEIEVSLVLTSTAADPEEITSSTGIEPDQTWYKGDLIGASSLRYKLNGWKLTSGASSDRGLRHHLESLIDRLGPGIVGLQGLPSAWDAEVACAIYVHESAPEIHFDSSAVAVFASLRAAIDVDVYCLEDE